MEKKKLTVKDVREAIDFIHDDELSSMVSDMSDEDLLNAQLEEDFSMDSLGVIELTLEMERLYNIRIPDTAYDKFSYKSGTVRDLIDVYNSTL